MLLGSNIKYHFQKILKNITISLSSTGGRNFLGRVCVCHKGAGNKNIYRRLDFYRRVNQLGFIIKVLKDSNRTGYIGLILYQNGLCNFILLAEGLFKGVSIFSGFDLKMQQKIADLNGSTTLLKNIGLFSNVNSIELYPLSGAKMTRAAGCSSLIISKDAKTVSFKMSSG
jgi:large subunit ribosomal protein L2